MFTKLQRLFGASSHLFSMFGRMAIAAIALAIIFTTTSVSGALGKNVFSELKYSGRDATANILTPPVEVTAPTTTRPINSTFTIPITVDDITGDGIFAFQFDIDYNSAVMDPSGPNFGCSTAGTLAAGLSPTCNVSPDGKLNISVSGVNPIATGPGTILNITFTAEPTAIAGSISPLTFSDVFFFNSGGQIANTPINGQVTLVGDPTITVTQTSNGTIAPGTTVVPFGGNQTFTITPNANYSIANVVVDGGSVGTPGSYTFTNVTTNHTITATYAINTYTLLYAAGPNGTLSGSTTQTVPHGGSGTAVTAIPNIGYSFVNWTDGSTANPRTDTNVTANLSVTANFAVSTYTLTYTAGANGTISGTSPQTVNHGASGSPVTAVPNVGYNFVNWSDGSTTNPRTDSNVTANIAVTANFAIRTYTLTYTGGANGTISGTSPQTVNHGANGTAVTAVPNIGYNFVNWSDGSTTNPRTDSNVTANIAVTANFAIRTYTLTYIAGANGTISGTSPQTVNHGANGTAVTAVPNVGYNFVNWSDGSTANPRTDTNITANLSVTANFVIRTYTLTYAAGANGSISGTSPQTVNHGANGTAVTAVPNVGYNFVNWSDGSTTNPRTDSNVTANISVTANFAIRTYTLTYTAGANGTISGTSPQTVNHGASGSPVTAVPNSGFNFVSWSDGSTTNPRTDTNVTTNITVTATFAVNIYTLTYTAGANGTISGTTPQTVASGGSGTPVTAVPNVGYNFVNWSDGSTANPRTDTNVTANLSVTANFVIRTYTLTYTAGANGTLTGMSPQTVNHGASGSPVAAVPNSGYIFVNWSDGSTTNPRTDTNVAANITVTANFIIRTYTLTYTAGANGTISGTSPQTVNHGASGSPVTAVPNSGYNFVNWSDGSTANPRTDTNVTANLSVTANFVIRTYTLTYTAGANGTVSGTSPQTVNHGASGTAVTAVPNSGFTFVSWSDGSTANPRTDTNVTTNITVTATFAVNTFTLTYTAGANGTITGPSPQTVASGGTGLAVTAVPNVGYNFVNWSDGSTANPRTDTNVTANISVTANFVIRTYTLTYTAGANGTVTGTSPQTVNHGANGTAVTAAANVGFTFVNWSDSSTANPRTDSNVTANITVTANFAVAATPTPTNTPTATPTSTPTSTPTATPTPGPGTEADIAPRFLGDGTILATDVTQIRRFAAGLDTPEPTTNEFQRADCAPIASLGDGVINSTDVIQVRRYAAGLDPFNGAGGPLAFANPGASHLDDEASRLAGREMRIGTPVVLENGRLRIPVEFKAYGDEVGASFTLAFDGGMLREPKVSLGTAAPSGADLTVNYEKDGHIGILIDSSESMVASGVPVALVYIEFDSSLGSEDAQTEIGFTSEVAGLAVSDAFGRSLPTVYKSAWVGLGLSLERSAVDRRSGLWFMSGPVLTMIGASMTLY